MTGRMSRPVTRIEAQAKLEVICMDRTTAVRRDWSPKVGDFYTIFRPDGELFLIVDQDEDDFHVRNLTADAAMAEGCAQPLKIPRHGFKEEGFGPQRIYVPERVLELQEQGLI